MFLKHFIFSLPLAGWSSSPGVIYKGELSGPSQRLQAAGCRDLISDRKLGFYLQSRSICNSIARVGFGHFVEAPMSYPLSASSAQPCQQHPSRFGSWSSQYAGTFPSQQQDGHGSGCRWPGTGRLGWSSAHTAAQDSLLPSSFSNSAPKVKKEVL